LDEFKNCKKRLRRLAEIKMKGNAKENLRPCPNMFGGCEKRTGEKNIYTDWYFI